MYSENVFNWNSVELSCIDIGNHIKSSSFYFKDPSLCIVAISRGGLVPARLIARELDVREIFTIAVSSYSDKTNLQQDSITVYQGLDGLSIDNINRYRFALFVDDIVDSGSTLDFIVDYWLRINENRDRYAAPVTASLVYKPKHSLVKQPDFFHTQVNNHDEWVIFPWEQKSIVDSTRVE